MKRRTTVYASQEYVLMAKAKSLNLSEIFEKALRAELGELDLNRRHEELIKELEGIERALKAQTEGPEHEEMKALFELFSTVANVPKTRGMQLDWVRRNLVDYPHLRTMHQTPDELLDQLNEMMEFVPKKEASK